MISKYLKLTVNLVCYKKFTLTLMRKNNKVNVYEEV